MSEGHYETLQDHVERIRALEEKVCELECLIDDVSNLRQEVDMIKFRERRR